MGKLLTILGVSEQLQETLPNEIHEAEQFLNVLQAVYEQSPDGPKKDSLANVISENVKLILAEIERVKSGIIPSAPKQEPEPEPKPEEPELPFKVGEKYCMEAAKYPYLIEAISLEKNLVTISGFYESSGTPTKQDFDIQGVIKKIKEGLLYLCDSKPAVKPKKERKPRQPKKNTEKVKPDTSNSLPEPNDDPTPEKNNESSAEDNAEKERVKVELEAQIEEIKEALMLFREEEDEYKELTHELNIIAGAIKNLNN